MRLIYLLFLLTLGLLPIQASYLLVAYFHTYENTLHSFLAKSSPAEGQCCDGGNCIEPCNTILNYCFKEFGTFNDFTNNEDILDDCLITRSSTELKEATDNIDFSDPPLTISNTKTWTSLAHRGDSWPGGMQFFVRATADNKLVDYIHADISLSPGENISNLILHGEHFGENVTFSASFNLLCTFNFYGDNCSVECKPANNSKDGHYTCDSHGNKICFEGYKNENCRECIPSDGCSQGTCASPGECDCLPGYGGSLCTQDMDVCGHGEPCHNQGNCNNTGPDSYQCFCTSGYFGVNCTEKSLPSYVMIIVAAMGGLLAPIVLLSPLLIILCFAGFGAWKNSHKEGYVNNPLYGQTPVPSINQRGSEVLSEGAGFSALSISVRDTPSPCLRPLDRFDYATIPAKEGSYNGALRPHSGLTAVTSIASNTFSDQNFSAMSINLGESLNSCNTQLVEPDYDIIPAEEGKYAVPPPPILAVPFSTSRANHSQTLRSEGYCSPTLQVKTRRSNTLPSTLATECHHYSNQILLSVASNTLRSESAHSNVSSTASNLLQSEGGGSSTPSSTLRSQYRHSNLLSTASNTLRSEDSNTLSNTFRTDHERGRSNTLSSETCNSFVPMSISERELTSPCNKPSDDDHKYDIVPEEGAYDVLPPQVPPNKGYYNYDVPRKADL